MFTSYHYPPPPPHTQIAKIERIRVKVLILDDLKVAIGICGSTIDDHQKLYMFNHQYFGYSSGILLLLAKVNENYSVPCITDEILHIL